MKSSSSIVALNPTLDDHGVLRVKGRANPPVAILPKDHPVTAAIVHHIHESIGHLGRAHLISRVREKLWIPQIRALVRPFHPSAMPCL